MFAKTAIVYASTHHGNTQKVIDAIANEYVVDLIDATKVKEADLSSYDLIGFASGIYFGKFHQSVMDFAENNMPPDKKAFLLCTCGSNAKYHAMEHLLKEKNALVVDTFGCKGYDTFGPFKLVGGIQKGHPDAKDLADAVQFYKDLILWILAS